MPSGGFERALLRFADFGEGIPSAKERDRLKALWLDLASLALRADPDSEADCALSLARIRKKLGNSRAEGTLRADLKNFQEAGLVSLDGEGNLLLLSVIGESREGVAKRRRANRERQAKHRGKREACHALRNALLTHDGNAKGEEGGVLDLPSSTSSVSVPSSSVPSSVSVPYTSSVTPSSVTPSAVSDIRFPIELRLNCDRSQSALDGLLALLVRFGFASEEDTENDPGWKDLMVRLLEISDRYADAKIRLKYILERFDPEGVTSRFRWLEASIERNAKAIEAKREMWTKVADWALEESRKPEPGFDFDAFMAEGAEEGK